MHSLFNFHSFCLHYLNFIGQSLVTYLQIHTYTHLYIYTITYMYIYVYIYGQLLLVFLEQVSGQFWTFIRLMKVARFVTCVLLVQWLLSVWNLLGILFEQRIHQDRELSYFGIVQSESHPQFLVDFLLLLLATRALCLSFGPCYSWLKLLFNFLSNIRYIITEKEKKKYDIFLVIWRECIVGCWQFFWYLPFDL